MKNVGIILAGGVGERVGLNTPKQLIKIAGRPIIEHTLDVFENSSVIDEIIVMMKPGYLDDVNAIIKKNDFTKVSRVLEGGGSRNDTTQAALAAINEECNVILHDAVRPLMSPKILERVIDALDEHDAVDVAIPSADTIIEVKEGPASFNTIANIPKRSVLRRGQTPQAFRHSTLVSAYEVANRDENFAATDDCGVVLKYLPEVDIAVVPGEERNMKVTEPIDIYLADKLFSLYSSQVQGDTDENTLAQALTGKIMVIFGGSYGIGKDIGDLAEKYGATVERFSRSETNTNVQNRPDIQRAHDLAIQRHGTGRLTSSIQPESFRSANSVNQATRRSSPRLRSTISLRSTLPRFFTVHWQSRTDPCSSLLQAHTHEVARVTPSTLRRRQQRSISHRRSPTNGQLTESE